MADNASLAEALALRLEDLLHDWTVAHDAAAELRRLANEVDELTKHLQFVERWANHHGQKASVTADSALSVIQHYPAIKRITKNYVDGLLPQTADPFAEHDKLAADLEAVRSRLHSCGPTCDKAGCVNARLAAEVEALRKDGERYRFVRQADKVAISAEAARDPVAYDAAIDAAMAVTPTAARA